MEQRTFGWRQLLGAVNLRDFADMVRGELGMIGASIGRAGAALPRLPLGPFIGVAFILLALVRLALLLLVVIAFGTAIAVITLVRGLSRTRGGRET